MIARLTLIALAGVCAVLLSACDEARYLSLLDGTYEPEAAPVVVAEAVVEQQIIVEPEIVPEPSSEPYVATSHVVCPEPFEYRGAIVQNPCWLEWY